MDTREREREKEMRREEAMEKKEADLGGKAKERVLRKWGEKSGKSLTAVTKEMGQLGRRHGTNEGRNGIKNKAW